MEIELPTDPDKPAQHYPLGCLTEITGYKPVYHHAVSTRYLPTSHTGNLCLNVPYHLTTRSIASSRLERDDQTYTEWRQNSPAKSQKLATW